MITLTASIAAAAVLLAGPAVASAAGAPAPGAASHTGARHSTSIRFLNFDQVRGYGASTNVHGQVVATVGGSRGAVAGVRVSLARKLNGTARWHHLETRATTHSGSPQFRFTATSVGNATYRVSFKGNAKLQPARRSVFVRVHRQVSGRIEDRTGRFHGRVRPHYSHRGITLQKRTCGTCSWHAVHTGHTAARGHFSFTVGAPRRGRWYWRVSTPASRQFIRSFSGVFTTRHR
jgi:hypothetical protein